MRNNLQLRNEFIMAPVKTGYGDPDGNVTAAHLEWYKRVSRFAGAITPEPFFLAKNVRELPTQIGIDNDDKIPGLKRLVDTIHAGGAKVIAHLNHPGRLANARLPGNIYISSSAVSCPSYGTIPKVMTLEDIKSVQELYVKAAIRAKKAGFDILEVQFGHGYLIAQFLSPLVNHRQDNYGGSFENRAKFGLEIIKKIREQVDLPIIVRISANEMVEGGLTLNDAYILVELLETTGIAAVHVSAGTLCESPPWYYQHMFLPKGKTWEYARLLREKTSLAIIAVGQIKSFDDVKEVKEKYNADYIALGRAMVADPDFVGKYLGQLNVPLNQCAGCLDGCLVNVKAGKGLRCLANAQLGPDMTDLEKTTSPKNIAIVGAGLAGMQAAVTLIERGHNVVIFERERDRIGGQFVLAPLPFLSL